MLRLTAQGQSKIWAVSGGKEGNRHMVRHRLIQSRGQKRPQRERIGQTPRDAALAIDLFKETDHHDPRSIHVGTKDA